MFRTLALLALFPAQLLADVVTLKDGRVLEGEVTQDDGKIVKIKLKKGSFTFKREEVASVEEKATPEEEYKARLAKLDGKSATAHLELAQWTAGRDLPDEALYHFLEAAKLDPALKAASEALVQRDYHLVDGVWQDPDTYYPAQGYLKLDGRWYSPQEHPWRLALKEVDRCKAAREETRKAALVARAKSSRLQASREAEEANIARFQKEITKAENDIEAGNARVAEEQAKVDEAQKEVTASSGGGGSDKLDKSKYNGAQRRLAAAKASLGRVQGEIEKARKRIQERKADIFKSNDRLRVVEAEKVDADAEVGKCEEVVGQADLLVREAESKAAAAKQEMEKRK